ncbi:protoporphyrinogen oxidase [Aquihabitans sp. G128]|uniref:protoporphyrinogen oxidase n=1 Tax=Aquihabitans sp. G128 TaxID=2849779 RepID=UPI001C2385AF|nr:protoporphyrinogen oxidase [Aquihabitans sp. G128]QXC63389.1 protoporphyrinogen oxidase [Aquihabitans sp. G128]
MTRPDHVVVVGGGIAGLTAAFRLSQSGADVTVVEPGPLGGKLQTSVFAGRPVDESADAFLLRVPWALALCHDLELDGELISPAARSAQVFVDGQRRALPEGHVLGVPTDLDALARTGLVSAAGLARAAEDLERPALPSDPGADGPDVAIGPYLRGRLGDEVVDHLIDPLVGGINAGDTATLSLAAVVPQLDAAARSGDPSLLRSCLAQRERALAAAAAQPGNPPIFATPIGGMARLVDALLAFMPGVEVRQGRRATAVELPGGPGPAARVVLDDGTVLGTDAVVVACPAHAAAPLLAAAAPEASAALAAIEHSSISMVTLAFAHGAVAPEPGVSGCLVPRDQGALVTAISNATTKWAQLQDPERDDVLLRVSAGRFGDDRHLDLDDDALTERVLVDLDRILGVREAPTEVRVGRWPRSFPPVRARPPRPHRRRRGRPRRRPDRPGRCRPARRGRPRLHPHRRRGRRRPRRHLAQPPLPHALTQPAAPGSPTAERRSGWARLSG